MGKTRGKPRSNDDSTGTGRSQGESERALRGPRGGRPTTTRGERDRENTAAGEPDGEEEQDWGARESGTRSGESTDIEHSPRQTLDKLHTSGSG